ncbi:MAG: DUF4345 domain-containing protein [Deltaproteobacteria bacterium]|nr:DUF4345 domain-containing protein [Deltaproteobacteria bacterium]
MSVYLWLNAVLYLGLAIWCMVLPERTSAALGYGLTGGSGRSEYLVVYGGLQIGLAAFFAACAARSDWHYVGVLLAVCLYVPIVLARAFSFVRYEGIGSVTIYTACLEVALMIWGIYLIRSVGAQNLTAS